MGSWPDAWWPDPPVRLRVLLWRGVEAQHRVATMKLVDTLDEQAALETLLEASKPPLPRAALGLPYLIATPFRYRSPHPSRFRRAGEAGIWYGAEDLPAACAEVAHWRWRFLMDSEGLRDGDLISEHTFFQAGADGRALDLTGPPWDANAHAWTHDSDYRACQALAAEARTRSIQWLRYASARSAGSFCGAVLDVQALALHRPEVRQIWVCKVSAATALMLHDEDRLSWVFG